MRSFTYHHQLVKIQNNDTYLIKISCSILDGLEARPSNVSTWSSVVMAADHATAFGSLLFDLLFGIVSNAFVCLAHACTRASESNYGWSATSKRFALVETLPLLLTVVPERNMESFLASFLPTPLLFQFFQLSTLFPRALLLPMVRL